MNTSTQMRVLARRVTAVVAIVLFAQTAVAVAPAAAGTVTVGVTQKVLALGQRVGVKGTTSPAAPRAKVAVERRSGATWVTVALGRTDSGGRFFVPIQPTRTGTYTLRIRSTVGYSPDINIRVLGPLVIDRGGLQTLRLGMTRGQAVATGWLGHCGGAVWGCPQAGIPISVNFASIADGGRLRNILLSQGATAEGLKIGDPISKIRTVYDRFPWRVVTGGFPAAEVDILATWPDWVRAYLILWGDVVVGIEIGPW